MGAVRRFLGLEKQKKGPSAEEIREQERTRARKLALKNIQEQEASRAALRGTLQEDEDEGEIRKKRLFGE